MIEPTADPQLGYLTLFCLGLSWVESRNPLVPDTPGWLVAPTTQGSAGPGAQMPISDSESRYRHPQGR